MLAFRAQATHIRAGEITAELVSCQAYTYRITITGYEDTESGVEFGEGVLSMGDGTEYILNPNEDFVVRQIIDGDKQIRVTYFEIVHTFPGSGNYTITYLEENRNEYILNMYESIETPFFIQTQVITDPFFCNNTPVLTNAPVDGAVVGQAFIHNPGAYDQDGDSLSFKMVVPLQDKDMEVFDYTFPDEYDRERGDNPNPLQEDGSQPVYLEIDPVSGTLIWDAPANPGEYNVAFIIEEWRDIEGEWVFLGYVTRDMQIIVEDAQNEAPELVDISDTCIVAGSMLVIEVQADDPDGDQLYFTAFGEAFDQLISPATFSSGPQTLLDTPAEGQLQWQTRCEHVRMEPYQVNVKVNDVPATGPTLADYLDFNVKVVGPPPVFTSVQAQGEGINLQWQSYACADQAVSISVYRKQGESSFTPNTCQTGLPEGLGFEKIGSLGARLSAYRDLNEGEAFEAGVTYCYRLVATYPDGSESLASEEYCVSIPSDAPFLTKVSVAYTSSEEGSIEINWSKSLNPENLPENYTYTLLRGTGFSGEQMETIAEGLEDTLFVDQQLNTEDEVYHYRVVVMSDNEALESSSQASSVRLSAQSDRGSIILNWRAEVPWSNQTPEYPYHYIYRAIKEDADALEPPLDEMVLLDSTLVNSTSLEYVDNALPEGLGQDAQICYVVLTRGRYNLELPLPRPLENFSQRICVAPSDSIPPCPPSALLIENAGIEECETFLASQDCDFSGFENYLQWTAPQNECADDIAGYNVYFAENSEAPYERIASLVTDEFFLDGPLASYAGCYRVSAVDLSGNESELSEPFCRDNCPGFGLPNVFTPNGDQKNETFTSLTEPYCPRFLQRVVLKVYNRWGKEVYRYDSDLNVQREDRLTSYWDGFLDTGKKASAGIYYYHAEVTFNVLDPSRSARTYKGWVHVLYEDVVGK